MSSPCRRLEAVKSHLTQHKTGGMSRGPITSHVLDTSRGCPGRGVPITISFQDSSGRWKVLASGSTNSDGRMDLLQPDQFATGIYKITFDTSAYFALTNTKTFFPYAEIVFQVENTSQHYHVPLLLSPFSYSTYRGS